MEEEEKSRFEGDTIVFDSYADTSIIISELLEADRRSEVCVIGDLSTEEFLPFTPTSDMVGHPGDEGPEN